MNRKINTMFMLATITLVVSLGVVYVQNYDVTTESSEQHSATFIPPGDKIKQKTNINEIANISEIKNLKGYDVSIGQNLPKGYKVQYVAGSISPDNYVNIFVGKNPITDETTDMDFVYGKGGGVAVTISPYDSKIHTSEVMRAQFDMFNPISVKILDKEGFGHDIFVQNIIEDMPTRAPAELAFVKDDKYIFLIGMVPLDTLIEIAKNF